MDKRTMKAVRAAGVAALFFVATTGAQAQGNFLDKAKGMLGGTNVTLPGNAAGPSDSAGALTDGEIGDGLREALRVGTERVVGQVGKTDGYNADPAIHLPLPGSLRSVQSALKKIGMSGMADDLELRLNRAAEAAAPQAKQLFV